MRKAAALKRGSRRKQQAQPQNDDRSPVPTSNEAANPVNGEKRKPTVEEASLTAKNYRLAKELSDLRVRHRDETKNVTRLTMENMNLASRCREAISHVAMLKKELAMHQRRAAEALAMQRQQAQRLTSNHSDGHSDSDRVAVSDSVVPRSTLSSTTDVAVEMERMDRILAAHAPPPPPPPPIKVEEKSDDILTDNTTSPTGELSSDLQSSPSTEASESPVKTDTMSSSPKDSPERAMETPKALSPSRDAVASQQSDTTLNSGVSDVTETSGLSGSDGRIAASDERTSGRVGIFPHSSGPRTRPKHKQNYNDEFPADITPASIHHQRRLPAVSDIVEQDSDVDSFVSNAREEANKKLSSIDAFEASFSTSFPESFNSPKEGSPREDNTPTTSEIYNPFFPTPPKPAAKSGATAESLSERKGHGTNDKEWGQNGAREKSPGSHRVSERSQLTNTMRDRSPVTRNLKDRSPGSSRRVNLDGPTKSEKSLASILDRQRRKIEGDNTQSSASGSKNPTAKKEQNGDTGELDPSSSPKIISRSRNGDAYTTPPQLVRGSQEASKPPEQPKRPEKGASLSARARYERALHPRGAFGGKERDVDENGSVASFNSAATGDSETAAGRRPSHVGSPPVTLTRVSQRRGQADEASINSQSSMSSASSLRQKNHGHLSSTSESKAAAAGESRRSITGRLSRPTPAERDAYSLPFDEEDNPSRSTYTSSNSSSMSPYTKKPTVEKLTKDSPSRSSPKTLSHDSIDAEIRALDAMAVGSSESNPGVLSSSPGQSAAAVRYMESIKSRRAVKEPVSYTEPSLKSKLRQGDVYFPKSWNAQASKDASSHEESVRVSEKL